MVKVWSYSFFIYYVCTLFLWTMFVLFTFTFTFIILQPLFCLFLIVQYIFWFFLICLHFFLCCLLFVSYTHIHLCVFIHTRVYTYTYVFIQTHTRVCMVYSQFVIVVCNCFCFPTHIININLFITIWWCACVQGTLLKRTAPIHCVRILSFTRLQVFAFISVVSPSTCCLKSELISVSPFACFCTPYFASKIDTIMYDDLSS